MIHMTELPAPKSECDLLVHVYSWTNLHTYLEQKLTVAQIVKKNSPPFTKRKGLFWCSQEPAIGLSWTSWIYSKTSHHISLILIFILSYHLCLGLPSGPFLSCFPCPIFPLRSTYPIHLIFAKIVSCSYGLLSSQSAHKLQTHPLPAVLCYLFGVFAQPSTSCLCHLRPLSEHAVAATTSYNTTNASKLSFNYTDISVAEICHFKTTLNLQQ
jgi:hypothetical protein